jgi:hypothetical protein
MLPHRYSTAIFLPSIHLIPKPIGERLAYPGTCRRGARGQITDPGHLPRLLRFGGERRGEETTRDYSKERAPLYHRALTTGRLRIRREGMRSLR